MQERGACREQGCARAYDMDESCVLTAGPLPRKSAVATMRPRALFCAPKEANIKWCDVQTCSDHAYQPATTNALVANGNCRSG